MRVCSVCSRCFPDAEIACVDPQHPALTDLANRSVDMVEGYRIERVKETSASIEKYLARQIETDAECVITLVLLHGTDPQAFLKDAKTAASMFHPSVVDIYCSGLLDSGEAFYISESPRSKTLREILKDGVPPLMSAIQIVREAAEAVHEMHTNGLTHGALRPENIFVAVDASLEHRAKVGDPDFGGAIRHSTISNKLTIDSEMRSIRYFAPEQFSSEVETPQTDVYALGTLLFEMLAGEPPFDGETAAELIEKIRNEHPPDIKINNFDLRMLLTHTIMQSLQKQPAFRQPTALAFARQLRHMEQLATHSATPPVPFPGAIPQKQAAAAAASPGVPVAKAPSPAAGRRKTVEITDVKKLGLERAKRPPETQPIAAESAPIETISASRDDDRAQADSTGDLNKSRLRNWKEKYQAVSSAFRTEPKTGLQQLSIATPALQEEKFTVVGEDRTKHAEAASAAKPTRIKVTWEETDDDIPSLEDVIKVQAEGIGTVNSGVEPGSTPAAAAALPEAAELPKRKPPVGDDLFGSFAKRPRVRKRAAGSGSFAALGALAVIAKDRRIIAGGLAAAVIIGLFLAGSIFDQGEARSAAAEAPGTKIVVPAKSEPAREVPEEIEIETSEPDLSLHGVVESEPEKEATAPARPKPAVVNETVRDVVQDPPRKSSNPAAVATQVANKPQPAKTPPKASLTPSTLVISPSNGKVTKKVEPGNGSAFTRPRIVANPKP